MFARTTRRGVPLNSLLMGLGLCIVILIVHFSSGGDVFMTLAKSSGAFILVAWVFITVAHTAMRYKMRKVQRDPSEFKSWFYPFTNIITIVTLLGVLFSQAFDPGTSGRFYFTIGTIVAIWASYYALRGRPTFGVKRADVAELS